VLGTYLSNVVNVNVMLIYLFVIYLFAQSTHNKRDIAVI